MHCHGNEAPSHLHVLLQARRKTEAVKQGAKGDKKDLNELKQELDIDDHKVPIEELYHRLGTNPETVSDI